MHSLGAATDGIGDGDGGLDVADVVDSDYIRGRDAHAASGGGAEVAPVGSGLAGERADETLAGGPDEDWIVAESRLEVGEVAEEEKVLGVGLGEADAGVEDEAPRRDTGGAGACGDVCELDSHVGDDVVVVGELLHGLRDAARVHRDVSRREPRDLRKHVGVEGAAGDVVDYAGAGGDGVPRDARPPRVDGDEKVGMAATDRLDERDDATRLCVGVDRRRAGPRRLAADVDDVDAIIDESVDVREQVLAPAVAERVRRRVDDAHDRRSRASPAQPRKPRDDLRALLGRPTAKPHQDVASRLALTLPPEPSHDVGQRERDLPRRRRLSGAAAATLTKPRSLARGCGRLSVSLSRATSPYAIRSRSISRGPYRCRRRRPSSASMRFSSRSSASGSRLDRAATIAFKNRGWSSTRACGPISRGAASLEPPHRRAHTDNAPALCRRARTSPRSSQSARRRAATPATGGDTDPRGLSPWR
mmetsp:Transcript_11602/g.36911  ORF Transcript_11602/g.36911 Transcript_11602/m.36911 type:complete len:475 (-) Transcript_11602:46-1470(-)